MSAKQQLQRDRAYFKFVISGIIKPINRESLTLEEYSWWQTILTARTELLTKFDERSRNLGLNVPEHKCWCGKKATVQKPETNVSGMQDLIWVCNKHKNN